MDKQKHRKLICGNVILNSAKEHTTHQLKLLYFILYKFKEKNVFLGDTMEYNGDTVINIPEEDFMELFRDKGMTIVEILSTVEDIPKSIKIINARTYKFTIFSIFTKISYEPDIGEFEFQLNNEAIPFVVEMENQFSIIPIDDLFKLTGKYSPRLFELFCMYKNLGYCKMSNMFMRVFLQISGTYNSSNLDRRVLAPAIKELKDKLGINVSYSKEKQHGIITHYLFRFN